MDTDLKYAIIKAAYEAWETGIAQGVEGSTVERSTMVVIPDTQLAGAAENLASRGAAVEEASEPKLWVEHEGRRAQIEWLIQPPIQVRKEQP